MARTGDSRGWAPLASVRDRAYEDTDSLCAFLCAVSGFDAVPRGPVSDDSSIDMQDRDNRLPHSSRWSDGARFEYARGASERARCIRTLVPCRLSFSQPLPSSLAPARTYGYACTYEGVSARIRERIHAHTRSSGILLFPRFGEFVSRLASISADANRRGFSIDPPRTAARDRTASIANRAEAAGIDHCFRRRVLNRCPLALARVSLPLARLRAPRLLFTLIDALCLMPL